MRRCIRNGNIFAFSLGMLVGLILPQSWIAVVAAVLLAVVAFVSRRCCRA
ncbi:MAG: hypothetical protein IJ861_03355 [Clostridia bacterium]|nr:hypothetical protein [Clostridia bacterium]